MCALSKCTCSSSNRHISKLHGEKALRLAFPVFVSRQYCNQWSQSMFVFLLFCHWNCASFACKLLFTTHTIKVNINWIVRTGHSMFKKRNLTQFIRRSQSNRIRNAFFNGIVLRFFMLSHSNYSALSLAMHPIYRNNSRKFRIKSIPPNANRD